MDQQEFFAQRELPDEVTVSGATREGRPWTVLATYDGDWYRLTPAPGSEFVLERRDWVGEWQPGIEARGMVAVTLEQQLLGDARTAIMVGYQPA
jgi:hypothetical protein